MCLTSSACSTSSDPRDWPVATYTDAGYSTNMAVATGTLRLVNGCVVLVGDDGSIGLPLFLLPDVKWKGDRVVVHGVATKLEKRVSLAGGSVTPVPSGTVIPEACSDVQGSFFVGDAHNY